MIWSALTLRARVWVISVIVAGVTIAVAIASHRYLSALSELAALRAEITNERAARFRIEQQLRAASEDRRRAAEAAQAADRRAAAARAELAELRRELAGGDCAAALQILRRRQQQ